MVKYFSIIYLRLGEDLEKNILITQRLQNDYISFLHHDDSLPSALHVGPVESRRLLGNERREGLLTRFIKSLYSEKTKKLEVINIIESHKLGDPNSDESMTTYGLHCIESTRGVEPINVIKHRERGDLSTHLVVSNGKCDFVSSDLEKVLKTIIGIEKVYNVSIFIVGVRTELNIRYLIYDLKFRMGINNINISSQLTTTSNRRLHFETLKNLERNFRVRIYDHADDFYRAMNLKGFKNVYAPWDQSKQSINFIDDKYGIFGIHQELKSMIKLFFGDYKDITLKLLDEEANGTCTYSVLLMDFKFRKSQGTLLRVGRAANIATEKRSIELAETFLDFSRPVIVDYIDIDDWGAIVYAFENEEILYTFNDYYKIVRTDDQLHEYIQIVKKIIKSFQRIHKRSIKRKVKLEQHYVFDNRFIEKFKAECANFLGQVPQNEYIALKTFEVKIYNPVYFFTSNFLRNKWLGCYFGVTHGNLNSKSIVIGHETRNIYLMNFFGYEEKLVLDDLAKFEVELKFLVELAGHLNITQYIRFEKYLLAGKTLNLGPVPVEFSSTQYRKLYEAINELRKFVDHITFSDEAKIEYFLAIIKHTSNKILDPDLPKNSKIFGFISIGMYVEKFINEINKLY